MSCVAPPKTPWEEQLAFFRGEGESSLLGILAAPISRFGDVAALVLSGGGHFGLTSRTKHLSRNLAASGVPALRFDWHGVGDSTGEVEHFDLDQPFVLDLLGAVSWAVTRDLHRYVVIGFCFGARTALAGAMAVEGVKGLVLVALSFGTNSYAIGAKLAVQRTLAHEIRRALRPSILLRILRPDRRLALAGFIRAKAGSVLGQRSEHKQVTRTHPSWINPTVRAALDDVTMAGINVLLIYGDGDEEYRNFQEAQRDEELGAILARKQVQVEILPGRVHHPEGTDNEEVLLDSIRAWAVQVSTADGSKLMEDHR